MSIAAQDGHDEEDDRETSVLEEKTPRVRHVVSATTKGRKVFYSHTCDRKGNVREEVTFLLEKASGRTHPEGKGKEEAGERDKGCTEEDREDEETEREREKEKESESQERRNCQESAEISMLSSHLGV